MKSFFKGYGKKLDNRHEDLRAEEILLEQDKLITEIFAPDPITLNPRSDLHFMYSRDSSPVVADFISKTLANARSSESGTEDPDVAIEFAQRRRETSIEYANRLFDFFENEMK